MIRRVARRTATSTSTMGSRGTRSIARRAGRLDQDRPDRHQRLSRLDPRRDRFARPDDPIDALKLENLLREGGLTLVFMDRVVPPLERGRRRDVGELIVAVLDYNHAGEFRRELAQKMIYAQTALAKAGFSVGGRPPFGFRRWLARADGTPVRPLIDGEYVKMAGHHVVWLPGPEEELTVIRRILTMLERCPPRGWRPA